MKLTLGKKLGLGFGVILALMVLSVVLTYSKATAVKETQQHTMALRVPTINALTALQRELNQTQSKGRQAVLAGTEPPRWDAAKKLYDSAWDDIGKDVAKLDELGFAMEPAGSTVTGCPKRSGNSLYSVRPRKRP